jgi:hypothetical protein
LSNLIEWCINDFPSCGCADDKDVEKLQKFKAFFFKKDGIVQLAAISIKKKFYYVRLIQTFNFLIFFFKVFWKLLLFKIPEKSTSHKSLTAFKFFPRSLIFQEHLIRAQLLKDFNV